MSLRAELCKVEADRTGTTSLWDCPCRDCWKLEMDIHRMFDIPTVLYRDWREERSGL